MKKKTEKAQKAAEKTADPGTDQRAEKEKDKKTGRYHNDYAPRFLGAYDIYDKAKDHMKRLARDKTEKK